MGVQLDIWIEYSWDSQYWNSKVWRCYRMLTEINLSRPNHETHLGRHKTSLSLSLSSNLVSQSFVSKIFPEILIWLTMALTHFHFFVSAFKSAKWCHLFVCHGWLCHAPPATFEIIFNQIYVLSTDSTKFLFFLPSFDWKIFKCWVTPSLDPAFV